MHIDGKAFAELEEYLHISTIVNKQKETYYETKYGESIVLKS